MRGLLSQCATVRAAVKACGNAWPLIDACSQTAATVTSHDGIVYLTAAPPLGHAGLWWTYGSEAVPVAIPPGWVAAVIIGKRSLRRIALLVHLPLLFVPIVLGLTDESSAMPLVLSRANIRRTVGS